MKKLKDLDLRETFEYNGDLWLKGVDDCLKLGHLLSGQPTFYLNPFRETIDPETPVRPRQMILKIRGMTKSEIRSSITDRSDGPLTAFVLTFRAFQIVEEGRASADAAANALFAELEERKFLSEDGFIEIPGT